MVKLADPTTATEKSWAYDEYYIGETDKGGGKSGQGENCWSGAKSLESYDGHFYNNTMHGAGIYRWRYYSTAGNFYTYEGHFYVNKKHGFGTMSFPDGRVFDGLFVQDIRWGPGVESFPYLNENVGLWHGTQLVRLLWRPTGPSPVPDFLSLSHGRLAVQKYRVILKESIKHIMPEVNKAQELLKQNNCDPIKVCKLWTKLYPNSCTDLKSQLCHTEVFEKEYYEKRTIRILEEIMPHENDILTSNSSFAEEYEGEDVAKSSFLPKQEAPKFYAWNNKDQIIHMMKQCYMYQKQKQPTGFKMSSILVGPRSIFRPAATHEKNCRALLMASYIGDVKAVTRLINEFCVHPNLTDAVGNNSVMYAACGDQTALIHFLTQATSTVDYPNDSCCTPLGIALLRFTCARAGVAPSAMLQALLPPPAAVASTGNVTDWIVNRDTQGSQLLPLPRQSKTSMPLKQQPENSEIGICMSCEEADVDTIDNYNDIKSSYKMKVSDMFQMPSPAVPYMFTFHEMIQDIVEEDVSNKKIVRNNSAVKASKADKFKSNKDTEEDLNQQSEQAVALQDSIRATISQLLCDGANPNLVKFPQTAIIIALTSNCTELVQELLNHGVNVNESYPDIFNYTALDLAISQKFTKETVEMVKMLLKSGANCNHRLHYMEFDETTGTEVQIPGPNLLHAILGRKIDTEDVEQQKRSTELLELLLDHNCDSLVHFKGQSPLDIAMTKRNNQLTTFVIHPNTNLNGIINESNQTVLVKIFTRSYFRSIEPSERLKILADLLLHGANPLAKCKNGDEEYENILVFIDSILFNLKGGTKSSTMSSGVKDKRTDKMKKEDRGKQEVKSKNKIMLEPKGHQGDKNKQFGVKADKSKPSIASTEDSRDYKLAHEQVKEYARTLHIRWLQAKLMKELAQVVHTYKHRFWNMILKDVKSKMAISLWLTPLRCLEIWDILSKTKKRSFSDPIVLKYLLYIVQFCQIADSLNNLQSPYVTSEEKSLAESHVNAILRDYKKQKKVNDFFRHLKQHYAMPELALHEHKNYEVCFECSLPLKETKILCENCNLVSFCDLQCIIKNIERPDCHPCNEYQRMKYLITTGEDG